MNLRRYDCVLFAHSIELLCCCLAFLAPFSLAGQYRARDFTNTENTVTQAYIAYYGRPADPGGLQYWANRLTQEGGDLHSIINAFGESQEFNQRFGSLSNNELITNIYQQLFNRDPDAGGLSYYLEELESARKTLQTIALDVLYGAIGDDADIIANKLRVSQYFTSRVEVGSPDIGLDADAMAALLAEVSNDTSLLPTLYCRANTVISGNGDGMLDGQSAAQQAFITARGYPDMFTLDFTTEGLDSNGYVVQLDYPTRTETWAYNNGTFVSSLFENGFFVSETTYGENADIQPTPLLPSQFTLCMNEAEIVALMGEPSCTEEHEMAGRTYKLLRYNPTLNTPAASIALEDGLFLSITAGYALSDTASAGNDICQ